MKYNGKITDAKDLVTKEYVDAKDIFIATYNTTSYADVLSAYNAGKYIVADYYDQKLALLTYDNNQFIFSFLYGAVTSSTIGQLYGGLITLESSGWDSSFGSCTPYQKPSSGIPKTDLASAVQTSLNLADSAYQKPANGIPLSDLVDGVRKITVSTTDIGVGGNLTTGELYFVYEA